MIRLPALFAAASLSLAACAAPSGQTTFVRTSPNGFTVVPQGAPSGPVVENFARSFLDAIQAQSIAERREYCGYFYLDQSGQLRGTPARPGTFATCDMPAPLAGQGIIASYHTHGAYSGAYDNEVPSVIDLTSDFDYGVDGYVSTPGGRVWLVDFQTKTTRQLCGRGCVTSDPGFVPQREDLIQQVYTIQTLQQRRRRSF